MEVMVKQLTLTLKINNREFICETNCGCGVTYSADCDCVEDLIDAIQNMEEYSAEKMYGAIVDKDIFEQYIEIRPANNELVN